MSERKAGHSAALAPHANYSKPPTVRFGFLLLVFQIYVIEKYENIARSIYEGEGGIQTLIKFNIFVQIHVELI